MMQTGKKARKITGKDRSKDGKEQNGGRDKRDQKIK